MSERAVAEEEYAQLRRAIRVDLTEELSGWVRRRFWWMAGLCGFAGVVGISSLFVLASQTWLERTLEKKVLNLEQNLDKTVFATQQKTVDTLVDNLIEFRLLTAELDGRMEVILNRIDEANQSLSALQTATASTRLLARKVAQVTPAAANEPDTTSAEGSVDLRGGTRTGATQNLK